MFSCEKTAEGLAFDTKGFFYQIYGLIVLVIYP